MGGSPHNTTAAPWLFSDPYAYRYDDIPDHIRLMSDARQQPRSVKGEEEQGSEASKTAAAGAGAGAVEAGSVPVFEMEGSVAPGVATVVPTIAVAGEKREGDSGLRFELEGCSGKGDGLKGVDLGKLTITPPNATTMKTSPGAPGAAAVISSPLAPSCLQVGGNGAKSPLGRGPVGNDGIELFLASTNGGSTPSTPTALTVGAAATRNGLPGRGATYRRPDVVTTNKRITTTIPAVTVTVPEARRASPPPRTH
ncbi:hypothetical protein PG984_012980 [Apiospora sp. TS-2023a]